MTALTALTAPQRRVLDAVTALWAELGHSPSQQEIAARAEIARGTVRWHLPRLAAAGQLRYAPGRYRCIVPLEEGHR